MPRLILRPMPQPPQGACIGTFDGEPLTLVGRDYLVGDRVIAQADIGEDLVEAVDDAATRVLGHEWVTGLARLMQINRRSTSKDRIAKSGLPEYTLLFLGEAAAHAHPRALGHALLCAVELQEAYTTATHKSGRPAAVDIVERNLATAATYRRALHVLDEVLAEREAFRRRREAAEAEWSGPRDSWRQPLTDE
ncbi:hypothetical protein SAMN05216360_104141 [Methylobacterium phyllostachyos]|uniref:Uncharacterized protein n=1 Tax=Methylobacterium phyllostachyos TaxID=582672 RepID=A0A1G9WW02_9HYPH|nr:hypothetical protein [Methylobacterium phyllostachyos]SDM88431.1 hypothetical protein SAMN05216360_104141 [Methylobacterium phyllostachyos]